MTWFMKILCKITGKSGYPYDTGEHPYGRFKLKMPKVHWTGEASWTRTLEIIC